MKVAAGAPDERDPGPGRPLGAAAHRPGRGADRSRPGRKRRLRGLRAARPAARATATPLFGLGRRTKAARPPDASAPTPAWSPRPAATKRPPVWVVTGATPAGGARRRRAARRRAPARPLRGGGRGREDDAAAAGGAMRVAVRLPAAAAGRCRRPRRAPPSPTSARWSSSPSSTRARWCWSRPGSPR